MLDIKSPWSFMLTLLVLVPSASDADEGRGFLQSFYSGDPRHCDEYPALGTYWNLEESTLSGQAVIVVCSLRATADSYTGNIQLRDYKEMTEIGTAARRSVATAGISPSRSATSVIVPELWNAVQLVEQRGGKVVLAFESKEQRVQRNRRPGAYHELELAVPAYATVELALPESFSSYQQRRALAHEIYKRAGPQVVVRASKKTRIIRLHLDPGHPRNRALFAVIRALHRGANSRTTVASTKGDSK